MDGFLAEPDELYAWFRTRPGSQQCASPFALAMLQWWLWNRWPRRIIEIGAGIGTCSALISQYLTLYQDSHALAVEDDPWCQSQWRENLAESRCRVLPILCDKLPAYEWADFVVLDGPQMPADGWACLASGATVFVEGNRRGQREELRAWLRAQGRAFAETPARPPDRSKGVWIIRCDPGWWERVLFMANRLEQWVRDVPARWQGRPVGKRGHAGAAG